MNYKIVADSSANMFDFEGVPFDYVSLKIITSAREYTDNSDLDIAAMVEEIQKTKGTSGTSCPNVHDWLEAFQGADAYFGISITSNLSGSYAAAMQAKADYLEEHPEGKIHIIDSLSAGPELRLIAEKLRELILSGMEFEEIVEKIQEYQKQTHLLFSLESLTNLARNGRVNPAVAAIAGVLGIRIVGKASDEGTLEQRHKCRGEGKAITALYNEMKAHGFSGGKVRMAHCFNEGIAEGLKKLILADFPSCNIEIEPTTALCSFYAEEGGMLVGYEG